MGNTCITCFSKCISNDELNLEDNKNPIPEKKVKEENYTENKKSKIGTNTEIISHNDKETLNNINNRKCRTKIRRNEFV